MKIIKKILSVFLTLIIGVSMSGNDAEAIVFIPPVIYIATLSLGALIVNISIFIAIWLAAQGVLNRLYFGKAMHEIVRVFFNVLGRVAILFIASVASVLFYNPLNTREVVISSILAGVLCLALVFLGNFREYRLVSKKEKLAAIGSMSIFFVLATVIIFISASSALKTKILRTGENGLSVYKEDKSALDGFALPLQKSAESVPKNEAEKGIAPQTPEDRKTDQSLKQLLWFYPSDFGSCEIYFGADLIKSVRPEDNCYYQDKGEAQRLPCPVSVLAGDIPASSVRPGVQDKIYGQGSCAEEYWVRITQEGFNMSE